MPIDRLVQSFEAANDYFLNSQSYKLFLKYTKFHTLFLKKVFYVFWGFSLELLPWLDSQHRARVQDALL